MDNRYSSPQLRDLHDRLGNMIDQIGHPDYSLRELVDGLRRLRDELFALSEIGAQINAAGQDSEMPTSGLKGKQGNEPASAAPSDDKQMLPRDRIEHYRYEMHTQLHRNWMGSRLHNEQATEIDMLCDMALKSLQSGIGAQQSAIAPTMPEVLCSAHGVQPSPDGKCPKCEGR